MKALAERRATARPIETVKEQRARQLLADQPTYANYRRYLEVVRQASGSNQDDVYGLVREKGKR